MSRIYWIKLDTDIYKNEKILLARDMADDEIGTMMVWVALLALAGKRNEKGCLMATDELAYTPKMLAREFSFPLPLIEQSLEIFIKLRMVVLEDGVYRIRDWEAHQNLERMERERESNRTRQANYRARKKQQQEESAPLSAPEQEQGAPFLPPAEEQGVPSEPTLPSAPPVESFLDTSALPSAAGQELFPIHSSDVSGQQLLPLYFPDMTEKDPDVFNKLREVQFEDGGDAMIPRCMDLINLYHKNCFLFPSVRRITKEKLRQLSELLSKYDYADFLDVFIQAGSLNSLPADAKTFDRLTDPKSFEIIHEGRFGSARSRATRCVDRDRCVKQVELYRQSGLIRSR